MKNLLYLLFFISIKSSAQDISGIYRGTLTNDSLKMIQNYELALSEYRGKITGYSYITFVYHDTLYYGIKRIKATKENGELIVEDVQMLSNNYPVRPNKGVHVINRIPLSQNGAIEDLNGKWETTESKKHRYYSIGGDMSLKKDNDSTRSALLSHLKELDIINYQEEKKESKKDIAKTEVKQKPEKNNPESKEIAFKESKQTEALIKQSAATEIKKKEDAPQKKSTEDKARVTAVQTTAVETPPKEIVAKPTQKQAIATETKSSEKKPGNTIANMAKVETKPATTEKNLRQESIQEKTTANATTKSAPEKTSAMPNANVTAAIPVTTVSVPEQNAIASSPVVKRITNTIQTVTVSADSLVLSFYDNGVVDGDSISVYLNNENIIEKVKLKEAAVKKTIYINGSADEIKLTLVAENLGSIPPNTGLLIIQDGTDKYQIRFSADMETNASVIIKKKKR